MYSSYFSKPHQYYSQHNARQTKTCLLGFTKWPFHCLFAFLQRVLVWARHPICCMWIHKCNFFVAVYIYVSSVPEQQKHVLEAEWWRRGQHAWLVQPVTLLITYLQALPPQKTKESLTLPLCAVGWKIGSNPNKAKFNKVFVCTRPRAYSMAEIKGLSVWFFPGTHSPSQSDSSFSVNLEKS